MSLTNRERARELQGGPPIISIHREGEETESNRAPKYWRPEVAQAALVTGRWEDDGGDKGKKWNRAKEATPVGVEARLTVDGTGRVAASSGRSRGRRWYNGATGGEGKIEGVHEHHY